MSTQKIIGGAFIVLAFLGLVFVAHYQYSIKHTNDTKQGANEQKLVLEGTCWTPCSLRLQSHPTAIRTDGDPLWIKFNGKPNWFPSPGKGDYHLPEGVKAGETQFVSRDPDDPTEGKENSKNPRVQVWVYGIE